MANKKKAGAGIADQVQPAFEKIAGLVDAFCREHLNDEWRPQC